MTTMTRRATTTTTKTTTTTTTTTPSLRLLLVALAIVAVATAAATTVTRAVQLGPELLANPSFETLAASGSSSADSWDNYGSGYVRDTSRAHSGAASIRVEASPGAPYGAVQTVTFSAPTARELEISGYVRSDTGVMGPWAPYFSLWADLFYSNGNAPTYAQYAQVAATDGDTTKRIATITTTMPPATTTTSTTTSYDNGSLQWFGWGYQICGKI